MGLDLGALGDDPAASLQLMADNPHFVVDHLHQSNAIHRIWRSAACDSHRGATKEG